jgi:hypothetical protein
VVVAKFVELRSQSPTGQEATSLPTTPATVWNLHCDRWRGLTWHDENEDIVWLLGVGWHASGSRDDAYAVLKRRDELDQLLPSVADYEDAERDDVEFFLDAQQIRARLSREEELEEDAQRRGWAREVERHRSTKRRLFQILMDLCEPSTVASG